jgi:PAS domain S-box-containing protein
MTDQSAASNHNVNDLSFNAAKELRDRRATRLSLALAAARLGDWSWDATTDLVTLSERAAEIFGVSAGQHLTWTAMRDLLHADDRERARLEVEKAISERSDYNIEYRVVQSNEQQVWVSARGRAVYDADGNVLEMLGIVQDITAHKQTQEILREQTETLKIINEMGQKLSAELDLQNLVQALTDAATIASGAQFGAFFYNVLDERGASYMLYTISGVPREHFAHFPMPRATDVFAPTFRGEGVLRLDDVTKDRRYANNSPYFGMPKGHLPVVSYLAVPVVSRSGEVLGGLFFGHEKPGVFTEQVERIVTGLAGQAAIAVDNARLYEAAQKARAAAETANRMKDEFLATVSHELRTPLNSMLGWASMLRTGRLDAEQQERALEIIERNAKSQEQIIEDILDVSRVITGKLRLETELIDLRHIVEAGIDSARPSAEAKHIRLETHFDEGVGCVLGDAHRLQQVIWNLLSNAIKFTPKNGAVRVELNQVASQAEIVVSDTGKGISGNFLPHVFDRFSQADSSTARAFGGLGLGLAIVRHLVELHGGSVSATSEGENQGATFRVRLPFAALDKPNRDAEIHVPFREVSPDEPLPHEALAQELTGVSVLCVDDEADARELLTTVLSQCGASVKAAASVREALEIIRRWQPTVIVSDIGMPGEDGFALIQQLRALPEEAGGKIPVAALTAYARSEDRQKSIAAGFQTHLAKPVNPAELAAVVARLAFADNGKS